ncbi:hypothetical protein L1887_05262 [Cichorium endivia]|nr:hypothetical protein L1887_05262 [Cichorium endivia]
MTLFGGLLARYLELPVAVITHESQEAATVVEFNPIYTTGSKKQQWLPKGSSSGCRKEPDPMAKMVGVLEMVERLETAADKHNSLVEEMIEGMETDAESSEDSDCDYHEEDEDGRSIQIDPGEKAAAVFSRDVEGDLITVEEGTNEEIKTTDLTGS